MASKTRKRPKLRPIKGCGQCAEIVAAHLLTGGFYEVMEEHLRNHKSRPGRLWGTR